MSGKLKIEQIARHTGLSVSTVSRVLAGKANTSAKAKQQVLSYAHEQGILETLGNGRLMVNNLVIFAPPRAFDIRADIFYYSVVQNITRSLSAHDVRIRHCGLDEYHSEKALFLDKMSDPLNEAAFIIGIDDPDIHTLAASLHKPCILINGCDRSLNLDSVSPDHRMIGEYSANYLIEQGHHAILTLQCLRRSTMELRLLGIKEAFAQHNLPFDDSKNLVTTTGFGSEESEQAITEFIIKQRAIGPLPSAIIAGGDFMAAGAVNALHKLNLRIPEDISLLSMDGVNLSAIQDVALTALHVPRDELGSEAIQLLQRRILRPNAAVCQLLLQGKLMVRESVKSINRRLQKPAVSTHGKQLY